MGSGIYPEYPGKAVSEPKLSQRAIDLFERLDALFESGKFDPTKIARIWNHLTEELVDKET